MITLLNYLLPILGGIGVAAFLFALFALYKSTNRQTFLRQRLQEEESQIKQAALRLAIYEREAEDFRKKIKDQNEVILQKDKEINRLRETTFLRDARKMSAGVLGSLAYGILIFNEKHILTFINSKAEEFLELEAQDFIGKSIAELSTMSNTALKTLARELSENSGHMVRKDVELRDNLTVEITKTDLMVEGVKSGMVVSLYDVTRARRIEQLKTEFVSLAAHQLRTPLSAIKWSLKTILEGDAGPISREQRELLRQSYASNEWMIRLINQLLEVTRIEEGKYIGSTVKISIESLVESILESVRPKAEIKKLELNLIKPKEKLPKVRVDVEQMRLVIENLMENAIQYTLGGGKVTVSLKYDKKGVELAIADTGIGVPSSQQSRIFERFFRGKNAVRLATEGSGLGLYIAKNIVEVHGGRIWFESQEGRGSVFYVWLPEAK